MKVNCRNFERALERWTLEEAAEIRESIERHACQCESCREAWESWQSLSRAAAELREDWTSRLDPSLLWPRIENSLQGRARPRGTPLWALAAAAVLVLLVSATLWLALHEPAQTPLLTEKLLSEQALEEVEEAEAAYIQSIERLAALAQKELDRSDDEVMAAYREKLQLIDSAILELQDEIEQNRYNAHLRRQLLIVYQDKQATIQQILRGTPDVQ